MQGLIVFLLALPAAVYGGDVWVQQRAATKEGGRMAGPLGVPALGLMATTEGTGLRRILGIPGATRLGPELAIRPGAGRIHIAPRHAYALIERHSEAGSEIVLPTSQTFPVRGIDGLIDAVVFSPLGSSAAIVSQGAGAILVVAGLPLDPRLARTLAYTDGVTAISDDGAALLLRSSDGRLVLWQDKEPLQTIYASRVLAAVSFLPGSEDAVFCDPARNLLLLARAAAGVETLLADDAGVASADWLGSTSDGQRLLGASAGDPAIWSFDLRTRTAVTHPLPFLPDRIEPLASGDTFLIRVQPNEAAWLLALRPSAIEGPYFVAQPVTTRTAEGIANPVLKN